MRLGEWAEGAVGRADATGDRSMRLVALSSSREEDAFATLIGERAPALLRIANAILGDQMEARDAVQDACIRAWYELPGLRDHRRFDAWLTRITINACRMALRARGRRRVREIVVSGLPVEAEPNRDPLLAERAAMIDAIERAFEQLDEESRTILVLHHHEQWSVVDIADILGIAEGTAKSRLHSARRRLERALQEQDR
jgi:RNA polymerase sigma-70 factor (ECF subfamily)